MFVSKSQRKSESLLIWGSFWTDFHWFIIISCSSSWYTPPWIRTVKTHHFLRPILNLKPDACGSFVDISAGVWMQILHQSPSYPQIPDVIRASGISNIPSNSHLHFIWCLTPDWNGWEGSADTHSWRTNFFKGISGPKKWAWFLYVLN